MWGMTYQYNSAHDPKYQSILQRYARDIMEYGIVTACVKKLGFFSQLPDGTIKKYPGTGYCVTVESEFLPNIRYFIHFEGFTVTEIREDIYESGALKESAGLKEMRAESPCEENGSEASFEVDCNTNEEGGITK
jgi:hypothetical protein